jgi:hypothetical protein
VDVQSATGAKSVTDQEAVPGGRPTRTVKDVEYVPGVKAVVVRRGSPTVMGAEAVTDVEAVTGVEAVAETDVEAVAVMRSDRTHECGRCRSVGMKTAALL